ncbi:MAG TPA: hypothetical protein VH092_32625 [Urbifossiella sp.]|jgi:Fe-S cluster assembly iron-binding protein IscA|nr:hypothetical protein [Urbifossiella sp.]
MILVWHGAGILVAVIWFASILVGDRLVTALIGPQASPAISNLTGEWLAAALTLALALLLRIPRAVAIDAETGRQCAIRPKHALFWIPVSVWPVIFFVLGIVVYFHAPSPSPAVFAVTPEAATKAKVAAAEMSLRKDWYVRLEASWPARAVSPKYSVRIVTDLNTTRDYMFEASGILVIVPKRQVEMLRGAEVLDFGEFDGEDRVRIRNPNLEGEQVKKWRRALELESPPGRR